MNVETRSEKEHFKFIKLILINLLVYLLMHTMANKFGYYCNVSSNGITTMLCFTFLVVPVIFSH